PEQRRRLRDAGLQFTDRERAALTGVAQGLTAKQIADRVGVGQRTIERTRAQLEHALGVTNLQDLRQKARDLGFGE
ncbi:MAG: LuxR C-terminal-related transcriptional regulator, partial [Chloroflexota bacterium]|nr:LuxR C-terminal-related transcriptional regulator [Chloroflexota bacterium]